MKKLFYIFSIFLLLISCNTDDDICTGGEGTPRMKIKFKTQSTGKPKTMDSIFVSVDYGNGQVAVIERKVKTDSLLVPLRVEDISYTDIYVSTAKLGTKSKIKVNYSSRTEYVSPACGIRKLYDNVNATLETPNPVVGLENAQNQIVNEGKTHLYLLF